MGASVRESNGSEPAKSEPSKSGPSQNERLRSESLRSEPSKDGALKRESLKRESLRQALNRQSSESEPWKNQPAKDQLKNPDGRPSDRATEVPVAPWKRKARRGVFEGDVAVVELRARLALAPDRIPEPAAPDSTSPTFASPTSAAFLRLAGGVVTAAVVAGVTGYLWAFKLSTTSPQLAPASGQANILPTAAGPAASLKASSPDSGRQLEPPAAIRFAPVDARGAVHDVASSDAAQQPSPLAMGPRSVVTPPPSLPPPPTEDPSEIAARVKVGEDLMADGDIVAARMMFERAAKAGDAAGAFALAETYDPMALSKLRLRGGITPDIALARSWYERAMELGSVAAPDRIVRLTQLPQ